MNKSEGRVLLPPNVEPSAYDIDITTDLERFSFAGTEKISVDVVSTTAEIQLHAKELYVSGASYTPDANGASVDAVEVNMHLKDSVLTLRFAESLPLGKGNLKINFRGDINNQMSGFYRSQYVDAAGKKKWMGSTQFEALDARKAFPCWDEPSRKATFTLTLTIASEFEALSNMPVASSATISDGKEKRVVFFPTPKMSTYLLCWCIGEFDSVAGLTQTGVLCKVYTPPGRSAQGRFALDVAIKSLEFYDDFFRVPYPLPKLDMIAIMDFAMGAMENWGLVTYREVDLLIDEEKASSQQRQRVASVVTHELAHQWFGNLVTMAWWDDLWLNEGFASWTQTLSADVIFPEWGLWTQFVCDDQAAALSLDALRTSHPIQVPIKRAEEVEEVFDAISYCKGASVIKMIHAILGRQHFQNGLQLYMERHQYGNTETFDLWRAWEEVSHKPIATLMGSWTEQMGFPLVEVACSANADDTMTLTLTQKWFLADGSEGDAAKQWTIPILIAVEGEVPSEEVTLMTEKSMTMKLEGGSTNKWFKLNAGQHVPMRVAYTDTEALAALARGIPSLPPEDRAGFLLDIFALAKAGHSSVSPDMLVCVVLPAYKDENHATVWEALETVLGGVDRLLIAAPDLSMRERFMAIAAKLVAPTAERMGWQETAEDGHLGMLLRATLIRLQARFAFSNAVVAAKADELWKAFFADPENSAILPAAIKPSVFKIVLKNSTDDSKFNELMAHLDTLANAAEKKHVYGSIGSIASLKLKRRVLEWSISGAIRLQDFFYAIGSVSQSSPEGLAMAWDFYQEKFEDIKGMLSSASPSLMNAAIINSISGFATEARAKEIEAFFEEHPLPLSSRKVAQAVESIRTSSAFLERLLKELTFVGC